MFTRKPITVAPTDTLAKAAQLMQDMNIGAVVVVEQYRPVGILTDRDIALAVCARNASPKAKASIAMTQPVATVRSDEGVFDATRKMMEHRVRRLPIVDEDGHLVGIITLDDLLPLVSSELGNMAGTIQGISAT
jgi:CBS domain-containing protein